MIRAALLLIVKNDKILFVRRHSSRISLPGRWSLPSGVVIADEKINETVRRCAWHELTLRVTLNKVIHKYHYNDKKEDKMLYYCLCTIVKGNVKLQHNNEIDKYIWISLQDFLNKFNDIEIGHGLQHIRRNMNKFKKIDK